MYTNVELRIHDHIKRTSLPVMSFSRKILCYNSIGRINLQYCSYVIICSLIIGYFIVNYRLGCLTKLKYSYLFQNKDDTSIRTQSKTKELLESRMKYILLWTSSKNYPFVYFGETNSIFVNKSCKWTNCYVTGDRNFLKHYSEFEVIVFNGPQLSLLKFNGDLPRERQLRQKYVFANIESAANYPFRDHTFNDYFNWTWTYKLNSDGYWGYIIIKDAKSNVIGPKEQMHWIDISDMDPIDYELKVKLQSKKKAAAWMSSNCKTSSQREDFVLALQHYLEKYNLKVDVYGECGDYKCPKTIMSRCLKTIENNYYFYLAFENSLSDDYVTEKVLYALKYNTIPIVYGGADYSRFLPEGAYLDAIKLGPRKLADTMIAVINNETAFYNFFRWKKYYSFHFTHETPETDSYCQFCAMINNETLMNSSKSYDRFNAWWMHKVTKVL